MQSKKKILLVEDDPEQRQLVEIYLSSLECEIVTAGTIDEALSNIHSDLDLAIVDFWIAGQDISPVLDALLAKHPRLPIIMVTGGQVGTSIETSHAIAKASGAGSFLQKPFTRDTLISLIQKRF